MGRLLKALFLLSIACNLYASDMLDGQYSFHSKVQESSNNYKYPFTMNLQIENNHITGDIDYINDNCSGIIRGKILSNIQVELSENITQGKDICNNGKYVYELKHKIIFQADKYTLDGDTHKVTINQYKFTPKIITWKNIILKDKISQTEIDINELRNDINHTKYLIEKSKQNKETSKYYLENNSTLIDEKCTKPPLAPEPKPFFDTEEKANHYALAYCSVSFGCRVGVELARDKLDTAAKRFLASQSCTLLVRTYQQENSLLDETMFNLLDAVSYAGCEDESDGIFSALMQGGSCVMSGATRIARVGQYMHCIDYKTQEFHNSYLDWRNAPEKKKVECDSHLKVMNETPKTVVKHEEEISKIEDKIGVKCTQLEQLNNELKEVILLREKQSELIKVLTK